MSWTHVCGSWGRYSRAESVPGFGGNGRVWRRWSPGWQSRRRARSGSNLHIYISRRGEVVRAFAGGDGVEQFAELLPKLVDRSFGGFAEQRLELGKELFDRV